MVGSPKFSSAKKIIPFLLILPQSPLPLWGWPRGSPEPKKTRVPIDRVSPGGGAVMWASLAPKTKSAGWVNARKTTTPPPQDNHTGMDPAVGGGTGSERYQSTDRWSRGRGVAWPRHRPSSRNKVDP